MLTLLVALPPTPVEGANLALADKTVTGLAAMRARWPGRVVVTTTEETAPPTMNLGMRWHSMDSLGVDVEMCSEQVAIERVGPDVVQLPLTPRSLPLVDRVPSVVVAENTALMKFTYAALAAPKVQLPRMLAGAIRQERVHSAVARRAHAVACNGWGAWKAYGRAPSRAGVEPILFFDNRIRTSDMGPAPRRTSAGPLSLAFSGRLHPSKGPEFAVEASRLLEHRGVAHVLHVFGDGPSLQELERCAGPSVRFHGDVPFDTAWVPFVRDHVDAMLLPHVQGDPAGTYVECAALGVPVLGFDNVAMRGHEKQAGFAIRTRRRTASSLADLVERVCSDPEALADLSNAGRRFLEHENMEAEFDRRVSQLVEVAERARS